MKMYVMTVYDKAVNAYLPPFYARAMGEAIRSFTEACADKNSNFSKYPLDFTLMSLGTFDDSNGTFEVTEPTRVLSAPEVIDYEDGPVPERVPRRVS